jgi:hypothetical protein
MAVLQEPILIDTGAGLRPMTVADICPTFDHVQAVAAATWTVDHGLGRPVAAVTVIDNSGFELLGAVEFPSSDQVVVRFTSPVSGRARVS